MGTHFLTAVSPLDGRYHKKLDSIRNIASEYGLIRFRVIIEIQWLILLTRSGLPDIPALNLSTQKILAEIIQNFSLEKAEQIKEIESTINHDVKAVEYFLKEQFKLHPELAKISEFIHFGCTSEDINNLAYGLMLLNIREQSLLPALNDLTTLLKTYASQYANLSMLARTHGQAATPTTLGKEMANVIARLERQIQQLIQVPIMGKMNGATGNYNALAVAYPEIDWPSVCETWVTELGLCFNAYTTQIEPHDAMAEFFSILGRINTILIDFCRDSWSYIAIHYFKQKTIDQEVGSSTMPHKINPIDFENAEGNLGIANALFQHMEGKLPISRWQRDLSDSTVLRNIGVAIGHSLLSYQSIITGMNKCEPNQALMQADLDQHWEVLAEPIQTMMRRYNLEQPYEKLKSFTRGKQVDKLSLHEFIMELTLPEAVKAELFALTPDNYIGYAETLAKKIS